MIKTFGWCGLKGFTHSFHFLLGDGGSQISEEDGGGFVKSPWFGDSVFFVILGFILCCVLVFLFSIWHISFYNVNNLVRI